MVRTPELVGCLCDVRMGWTERVAADGTDLLVGSADCVSGVRTGGLVMVADRVLAVCAVVDEVGTVGFLALDARFYVFGTVRFVVVRARILVVWTQCIIAGGTGCAVFRADGIGTGVAVLGVVGAGGRVADGALDAIGCADLVITGCARIEVISTELLGAQRTLSSVVRTDGIATVCAGFDVIGTDDGVADPALATVSPTDCLPARLTGREVVGSERVGTDLAVVVMIAAQCAAAPCAVGCVIRTEHVTAGRARRGVSFADAVVARGARQQVCIGEVIDADDAG